MVVRSHHSFDLTDTFTAQKRTDTKEFLIITFFILEILEVIHYPSPDKRNQIAREAQTPLPKGTTQVTALSLGLRQFASIDRGHIVLVGNSLSAWKHTTDWQGMEERGEVQGPHNRKVVSQTFGCHASPQNTLVISSLVTRKKIFERTYYIKLKKLSTHHCTHYLRRKYLFFSPFSPVHFYSMAIRQTKAKVIKYKK